MKKEFLGLGLLLIAIGILIPTIFLSSTSEKEGMVKVNLTVFYGQEMKNDILTIQNGTAVFDVLNESHKVGYKEYSGLGKLIIAIDDIEQNSSHSWFYWVNDKFSDKSTDNFILTENSNIVFRIDDMTKFFP